MNKIGPAIELVASQYGVDRFETGDCHTLAMALHEASAPWDAPTERKGRLMACLCKSIDEDGSVFSVGYSHMVYVTPDGVFWDIRGIEANKRWEAHYDTNAIDKWGMKTQLDWVDVPCIHPHYCDTHIWLQEHYAGMDLTLQNRLSNKIRDFVNHL